MEHTSNTPFEPQNRGYRARSSPSPSKTVVVFLIPSETLEAKSKTPATGFAMALIDKGMSVSIPLIYRSVRLVTDPTNPCYSTERMISRP
jgi:hypothetical protein